MAEETTEEAVTVADIAPAAPDAPEAAAAPAKEDAGTLLDDLAGLLLRAEHFENAGLIGKLRADGLALVARIRAAI